MARWKRILRAEPAPTEPRATSPHYERTSCSIIRDENTKTLGALRAVRVILRPPGVWLPSLEALESHGPQGETTGKPHKLSLRLLPTHLWTTKTPVRSRHNRTHMRSLRFFSGSGFAECRDGDRQSASRSGLLTPAGGCRLWQGTQLRANTVSPPCRSNAHPLARRLLGSPPTRQIAV